MAEVTIADTLGWEVTNLSGIGDSLAKAQSVPVPYEEAGNRYRERGSGQDLVVEREFLVPYSGRFAWLEWVIGYSYTETVTAPSGTDPYGFGKLHRVNPLQDPERPWLYATDYDLIGREGAPVQYLRRMLDGSGDDVLDDASRPVDILTTTFADMRGKDIYKDGFARYLITFKPRPFEIRDDDPDLVTPGVELRRNVTREVEYSIRNFPIPKNQLVFIEAGEGVTVPPPPDKKTTVPQGGTRLLPGGQLLYTWHDVPDIPWQAFRSNGLFITDPDYVPAVIGCVNKFDFDTAWPPLSLDFGWDAGTLLCQAPRVKWYRNIAGRVTWDITYRFDFNPYGWNRFPTAAGEFLLAANLAFDTTSPKSRVYLEADFARLFTNPAAIQYEIT